MSPTPAPLQTLDFWRVNSYGYPNPFSRETKSQEAWLTFKTFCDHDNRPYSSLKTFWESSSAPRRIDSHAVESWKATFEEFGLLYVISRSNKVRITPAGKQFREAADQLNEQDFVWIGLNLLFRYPLQGPPRSRNKSPAHGESDVLPYRFLYSAMRDLGDYFWWTELERILCRVFSTSEAKPAVAAVREIRENLFRLASFSLPVDKRKGAFYNSLNQVVNHAGMNHLVLIQDNESEQYGPSESRRRHFINRQYLSLVSVALGDSAMPSECTGSAMYVDRLPTAPSFTDEQKYFDYLGAPVPNVGMTATTAEPQTVTLAGDTVFVLKSGEHFEQTSASVLERRVQGKTYALCRVARNHRVILSTDLMWTYLVTGKDLVGPDTVQLSLRRARPITNIEPIEALFGGENG
jgi:hypothetical protein